MCPPTHRVPKPAPAEQSAGPAKVIVHCLNGILTDPYAAHNWNKDAAVWYREHAHCQATADTYFAGVILAKLLHRWRVAWFVRKLRAHRGKTQIVIAHSNGCRIAVDALARAGVRIERLVLVAGAVNSSEATQQILDARLDDYCGSAIVTKSSCDAALRAADEFGWCHEPLGLYGPIYNELYGYFRVVEKKFGHSEWFNRLNFEDTLRLALPEDKV